MTSLAIYYIEANIILCVSAVLVSGLAYLSEKFPGLSKRDTHRIASILSFAALGYLLAAPFLPSQDWTTASAQIWSAASIKDFEYAYSNQAPANAYSVLMPAFSSMSFSTSHLGLIIATTVLLGLLIGMIRIFFGLKAMLRLLERSHLIRKLGKIELRASLDVESPCSFLFFRRRIVLLPPSLLEESGKFRLAIAHELQHHRQGDTFFVYVFLFLRHLFFFNPLSRQLEKTIERIQEFACDEALLDHHKVSALAYGRCLVEVAESAKRTRRQAFGAVGMATSSSSSTLRRRINIMINQSKQPKRRSLAFLFGAISISLLTATAYASRGSVHDRRIDIQTAEKLVEGSRATTSFPLEMNHLILSQLNRYVGTPDGREHMRRALIRMKQYETMVRKKILEYRLPEELLAVAVIESGFRNYLPNKNPMRAAGVWQFVPQTARNYALTVNSRIDERLDVFLATDAAMRLLRDLNNHFQDWKLALMAYNAGSQKVQKGIEATGSRNAWDLIQNGHEGDKHYLSRVIAAAIVLRNPELVE